MVDRIHAYGSEISLPEGSLVFERGDRGVDFFVVLQGYIEIFEVVRAGESNIITVIAERQFNGELHLVNANKDLVNGPAGIDSRVL
jgi:thioredoxin reductase (NADPH)